MIIVLINWRIRHDGVEAFLDKWKTQLTLQDAPGLIGEFLSRVETSAFHEGVTWEMEPDEKDVDREGLDCISFVNVGMWERIEDFMEAVGKYMSRGRTIRETFEAAPRRRAVLTPEHWRRGSRELPSASSVGVDP